MTETTPILRFTDAEAREAFGLARWLLANTGGEMLPADRRNLLGMVRRAVALGMARRDGFGTNPVLAGMRTSRIIVEEMGLKRDSVISTVLFAAMMDGEVPMDDILERFGRDTLRITQGLWNVRRLYARDPVTDGENFRDLLLTFAGDMRVVLIMIAGRLALMRDIRDAGNQPLKERVSREAERLYAPLAHKLGLYRMKSELEDLALKYLERDAYYMIREKLSATKRSRDAYIEGFIGPVREGLDALGLRHHVKGRTKSIHSIWQKMKRQRCAFEGIYDLFAIRIVLDSPLDQEKIQCWQAFAMVTNMYQPNPRRLRDWISAPKPNGYESLHITVLGPGDKWVEVQIRTSRMDEVAERGLAAHWRYKGVKAASGIDGWLASVREALDSNDDIQPGDMDLSGEVFVFTPKGDLMKFPKGATVLDFAYRVHTKIGNHCTGARIGGKAVTFRHVLGNGEQVQVVTSATQRPKREWLEIARTPRARSKIRLAVKELEAGDSAWGREMLERRLRNHKLEWEEASVYHLVRKLGYREAHDFYCDLASGGLDMGRAIEAYGEIRQREAAQGQPQAGRSASDFLFETPGGDASRVPGDVLVIDRNLKDVDFSLAKCCKPIYGDSVFGFVTVNGGIKVHRDDCPNAAELRRRFGYRIVRAVWSGKGSSKYSVTLKVIGNDDIGIVNNITSVISKEERIVMRSINIDSDDGLFHGNITVDVEDTSRLKQLVRKIRAVKGVKQVTRL